MNRFNKISEITAREANILKEANILISHLAILIKTAEIHDINNIAVIKVVNKLHEFVNTLITSGPIKLQLVGEFFFLRDCRVRYVREYSANYDFLKQEFRKRELGTLTISKALNADDIKILVSALSTSVVSETPMRILSEELDTVPHIQVEELKEVNEDNIDLDKKKKIKRTYSGAVSVVKGVLQKIQSGEKINLKQSKRVIETITDQIMEEESQAILIGMTSIKDYDDYTYNHSVNVSIFAMAFGHKLNLPKVLLAELGLAALFHDIGKIRIPIEVLNKPTSLTTTDWKLIQQHPVWGALTILKIKGINDLSIDIAISAFEHHLNYDLTGYPSLKNSSNLEFFSKIISIADHYDAMTSSRVYSRKAMSPDRALMVMISTSGTKLDPQLLKMFVHMIGTYPIGCLVMLDTNELGLIFENNANPSLIDRPRVLLITDGSGTRIDNTVVDLTEKDQAGNYTRSIVKTLDANQYGINLSEYLL